MTTFDPKKLTLQLVPGGASLPDGLADLRREIYVEETGYIDEAGIIGPNDSGGIHILLRYEGALIAAAHSIEAEKSDFPEHSGIAEEDLKKCVYVSRQMVRKEWRGVGLSKLMIYIEAREGRMRGRDTIIVYMTEGDAPNRHILAMMDMAGVPKRRVKGTDGQSYNLVASGQDIAYGAMRCWNMMRPELRDWVAENLLADEAIKTVEGMIAGFYDNEWFRRVEAGTLSRRQYLITLGNWHQFVRWTTRLLGLAVHITEDARLRRHYVEHLTGELDHEKWIERDLAHVGGDVPYVVKDMVPVPGIRRFMALQESIAGFHRNPVLFLAIPFSIEGLSGKLPPRFVTALKASVSSWGFSNPAKGCTFLASHVHTDGGEDGHWAKTKDMIRAYLRTEKDLQDFLHLASIVVESINDAFDSFVRDPDWTTVKGPLGVD